MTVVYPFYFQYDVQPARDNPEYETLAGAIATVIVFAENGEIARARAGRTVSRHRYRIQQVKRSMVVQPHQVEHMEGVMRSLYTEAEQRGIGVVFDGWRKKSGERERKSA